MSVLTIASTILLYHNTKAKCKNFFVKIANDDETSFWQTARRATARRAERIPQRKRNGRRFAPPAKI
jgi:hypothetical protein